MDTDEDALAGGIEPPGEPRRLSGLLILGLLVAPPAFVWLLLRRGYATSTRVAGFIYAAVMLALGLYHTYG